MRSINLRLSDSTHRMLVQAAKQEKVSLSQYIREAALTRALIEHKDGELLRVWEEALRSARRVE